MVSSLLADNEKLVALFGAERFDPAKAPDFYVFRKGLVYSHRDFGSFLSALKKGKRCAIVSGVNASGSLHLGHKAVFDTNLYFQREFGVDVFIPISDDESYVSGKVDTQEQGLENARRLARELLGYGFDSKKTFLVIDQVFTNIYNLAIKLSRKITLSEVKATYGYENEANPGLYFYPAVQAAHVLMPFVFGYDAVLVPIGPDEDAHLRIARDIAAKAGFPKPAVLHVTFQPGLDGEKMSKSRNNTINLNDDEKTVRTKINKALSGGQKTVEEHREKGGNPDQDMSLYYLQKYFLTNEEGDKLVSDYRKGLLLSGELKKMLADHVLTVTKDFQRGTKAVTAKQLEQAILTNKKKTPLERDA